MRITKGAAGGMFSPLLTPRFNMPSAVQMPWAKRSLCRLGRPCQAEGLRLLLLNLHNSTMELRGVLTLEGVSRMVQKTKVFTDHKRSQCFRTGPT